MKKAMKNPLTQHIFASLFGIEYHDDRDPTNNMAKFIRNTMKNNNNFKTKWKKKTCLRKLISSKTEFSKALFCESLNQQQPQLIH